MIKANNRDCYLEELKYVNRNITKDIIKKIENIENCYNVKLKKLYGDILLKSEEAENIPNYISKKSKLYIKLINTFPKDISDIDLIAHTLKLYMGIIL